MPSGRTNNESDLIRICVRDATRMGTQLLTDVLRRDRRFEVVECGCNEELQSANVQVAVLHCDPVRRVDELDSFRRLHMLRPELKTVALMDDPAPAAVLQAFRVGVRGIFCRSDSYKTLSKCLIKVAMGQVWASQTQVGILVEAIGRPFPMTLVDAKGSTLLSPREEHVVHWVAEGLTNREIADRMRLSEHTVKNYLFRIFDKLGVSSRAELVLYAVCRLANGEAHKHLAQVAGQSAPALCESAACPVFQLSQARKAAGETVTDHETAYVRCFLAQAISASIQEQSTVVLRDLENRIPAKRLAGLKQEAGQHLRETLKAAAVSGPQTIQPARGRVA